MESCTLISSQVKAGVTKTYSTGLQNGIFFASNIVLNTCLHTLLNEKKIQKSIQFVGCKTFYEAVQE